MAVPKIIIGSTAKMAGFNFDFNFTSPKKVIWITITVIIGCWNLEVVTVGVADWSFDLAAIGYY